MKYPGEESIAAAGVIYSIVSHRRENTRLVSVGEERAATAHSDRHNGNPLSVKQRGSLAD